MLTLDKATGKVTCDLPGLATLAQEQLDRCIDARTGGDVTRVVQRLFERQADLFPIREQGGCYFVPQEHVGFVDRVQAFLGKLNGRLVRFPVPAGTPRGRPLASRRPSAAGLAALIDEHRGGHRRRSARTRAPDTLERAAERIRLTRHKVEAYAELPRRGARRAWSATSPPRPRGCVPASRSWRRSGPAMPRR